MAQMGRPRTFDRYNESYELVLEAWLRDDVSSSAEELNRRWHKFSELLRGIWLQRGSFPGGLESICRHLWAG